MSTPTSTPDPRARWKSLASAALHFPDHPELEARYPCSPICLACRNSGIGTKARQDLIAELHVVAQHAEERYQIAVECHLPSDEQLHELLRRAPAQRSTHQGQPFTNRHVEIDLRKQCGAFIFLSLGSGRKVDESLYIQPYIHALGLTVQRVRPCLVLVKNMKRTLRNQWAAGDLILPLQMTEGWIGDLVYGLSKPGTPEGDYRIFQAAGEGEREAKDIAFKGSRGMADAFDPEMVNGRCAAALNTPAPPGFARVRLRGRTSLGTQLLCLDGPAWLPDESEVAYGLPTIRDENGELVNQVENVQYLLARLGKPDKDTRELMDELYRRGFSTEGIRQSHESPDALWHRYKSTGNIHRLIGRYLELYRTGILTVKNPAVDGGVKVTNCQPPGGWMTEDDYHRIRQFLADNADHSRRTAVRLLTGLPVTANGTAGYLMAATHQAKEKSQGYRVVDAAAWHVYIQELRRQQKAGRVRSALSRTEGAFGGVDPGEGAGTFSCSKAMPDVPTFVDWSELHGAILDGIRAAGDTALRWVPFDVETTPTMLKLRRAIADAKLDVNRLGTEAQQKWDLLNRKNGKTGKPMLTGRAAERANSEYNDTEDSLVKAKALVEQLEQDLEHHIQTARNSNTKVATEALLDVVAQLGTPFGMKYKRLMRSSLHDVKLDAVREEWHGRPGWVVTFSGELRSAYKNGSVIMPFSRTWRQGYALRAETKCREAVERLAAGETFEAMRLPNPYQVAQDIAEMFGDPVHPHFWLATCTDTRILRTAFACHYRPDGRTPEQIAHDLEEPIPFVERVKTVWENRNRGPWRIGTARVLVRCLLEAQDEGRVNSPDLLAYLYRDLNTNLNRNLPEIYRLRLDPDGSWRIGPCETCGATQVGRLQLREVIGAVCLECRTDSRGVTWKSDPYDRYLETPRT